jgi:glycerophosphoryl diester phosphodiesterase
MSTYRASAAFAAAAIALLGVLAPAAAAAPAAVVAEPFPYPDAEVTLINHRGLSPGFPENTLAAFRNSIAMGVDAIEIDLRATSDGEIVILHDDTVDRTTDGTGPVSRLTLAEVKALDAGSYLASEFAGERVPTYAETLDAVKGTGVMLLLDIKISSQVEQIMRLAEARDMVDQIIVGPRSVSNLQDYLAINPDLTTLGFIPTLESADDFIAAGVDFIRLWPDWITQSRDSAECQADYQRRLDEFAAGTRAHPGSASCAVEHVTSQGTPVWSTTNDLGYDGMDELLRLGATGLLSDVPGELARLLADVEALRITTAAAEVATLRSSLAADFPVRDVARAGSGRAHGRLISDVQKVRVALERSSRALDDGAEQGCRALADVTDVLEASSLPSPQRDGYASAATRTLATLACSRF